MSNPGFVHLHCHSDGSTLDGANRVSDLIKKAVALQMPALAITDHGNMYTAREFYDKAKAAGIKPILGMEAYIAPGDRRDRKIRTPYITPDEDGNTTRRQGKMYYHLVMLAQNMQGYRNLCKLSRISYTEGFYMKPRLDREVLRQHSEGIVISSACMAGEVAQALLTDNWDAAREAASWYAEVFKDRYYLEVQAHDTPGQSGLNEKIFRLGEDLGLPVLATNDAHFLNQSDHHAHDALVCIGMGKNVKDSGRLVYDEGLYFKDSGEMASRFAGKMEVLEHTLHVAEGANMVFDKKYHVPTMPMRPEEQDITQAGLSKAGGVSMVLPQKFQDDPELTVVQKESMAGEIVLLRALTYQGATVRYGEPLPENIRERLEFELDVISNSGYAGYLLIVADFIREARDRGIPVGPGRGSAAGSAVCYCLKITDVEPLKYDLLFERFLNPERVSMPDIDVDFCFEHRQEIIEYVREKYGRDAVAQIVTFGTLKSRAVVKDVGRVLEFTPQETDALAKLIPNMPNYSLTVGEAVERIPEIAELYKEERYRELLDTAKELEGLRRHVGVHAAGVVIAPGPVDDYVPVSMQKDDKGVDQLVTQFDMTCLEKTGMLKMDFLGLKTLTVMEDTIREVRRLEGVSLVMADIPMDDEAVFAMIRQGRTKGIFQFESALGTEMLQSMRADSFDDLVATTSLMRPGPLDAKMHEVYIRRKRGEEKVVYPHPDLEPVLKSTYGVITYQEQVMRVAQVMAGVSLAEADVLRKAVGKKDADLIKKELGKFSEKAEARGYEPGLVKTIAGQIETFGRYGFNKSHAVAYSMISYHTAWLKAHYPVAFIAALVSSKFGDTEAITSYLNDARAMGIQILPPAVTESDYKFRPVRKADDILALRFGLGALRNVGESLSFYISKTREERQFHDFFDFVDRVFPSGLLTKQSLEALIRAGACDGLGANRAQMLAGMAMVLGGAKQATQDAVKGQLSIFDLGASQETINRPTLPKVKELPASEILAGERTVTGLYLSGHPLEGQEEVVNVLSTHTSTELNAQFVSEPVRIVAAVMKVEEKASKKDGRKRGIVELEDLHGTIGAISFSADERKADSRGWEHFKGMLVPGQLVVVTGNYSRKDQHADKRDLMISRVEPLDVALASGAVRLAIRFDNARQPDSTSMERIRKLMEEYKANAPVEIVYLSDGVEQRRREANSRVRVSPDLVAALREVEGINSVVLEAGSEKSRNRSRPDGARGSYGRGGA